MPVVYPIRNFPVIMSFLLLFWLHYFTMLCFAFLADGVTVFCNIAEDESLFTGKGDYQFDVYRLMKKANKYVVFLLPSLRPWARQDD